MGKINKYANLYSGDGRMKIKSAPIETDPRYKQAAPISHKYPGGNLLPPMFNH